ncbi:MAG TPA: aldehyde dehydrogenase family protein, partial [Thermoanaerobaculia bacterium]|nr:aldehyde dehydrogenase family protein [Thermoanaerobaculia bacterium]
MLPEFANEPLTDFSAEWHRSAFRAALAKVEARLPIEGKNRIGGNEVGADETFNSVNPCNRNQVIGRFPQGTREDADRAVEAAWKAFPSWSRVPPEERSALLLRVAAIFRKRKHEFSAMMVLEESKSWA